MNALSSLVVNLYEKRRWNPSEIDRRIAESLPGEEGGKRGFAVDENPVPYGDLSAQTETLTGILSSEDPIDNVFYQWGYDTYVTGAITLVPIPEPSSVLLLASGLVALAARRRRRG